ncbi:MAG: PilZ domain-containing protein [Gammaproteobacteria bacterium]
MPARQGIVSVSLKDKAALYSAYMPFVKHGGLFIATNKAYQLGDEIFLLLSLMNEPEKFPIAGRVIWITPKGAQGGRQAGIGVQFSDLDGGAARNKIEGYLAGMLQGERETLTM